MEWLSCIRKTIDLLEEQLLENAALDDDFDIGKVAREVGVSAFYLQKGFAIMTGYSIAEYVRNRRLYLAALDILSGSKVIDVALNYGYDTPDSFTKAFSRFHGVTPMQLKNEPHRLKTFLPLKINITIQGSNKMDYIIEDSSEFTVIGFEREIANNQGYEKVPKFWDEIKEKHLDKAWRTCRPENAIEEAILKNNIGMLGICIDDNNPKTFRYMIAGLYKGGEVPEGLTLYKVPKTTWAKFLSTGPLPGALQSLNTKIFKEWLPGNADWEFTMGMNIEYYMEGDSSSADYHAAIWIPVKKKG